MATDLSTLTETELTELLSSVTPYSKQEMISFLRNKVKILDKWDKVSFGDAEDPATGEAPGEAHINIYFTPIHDVRALKYIQESLSSKDGSNRVFFQFLKHQPRKRRGAYSKKCGGGHKSSSPVKLPYPSELLKFNAKELWRYRSSSIYGQASRYMLEQIMNGNYSTHSASVRR